MSINITVSSYCHFLERADAIGLFLFLQVTFEKPINQVWLRSL